MDETSTEGASALIDKGSAVALVTLARYLARKDPGLVAYLRSSLEHARSSGLQEADLAVLKLLVGAIGGS